MIIIGYKHINVVQYNMGNGITEPKLALTDDNISVVIKTNNCPEGNLILFNEYFCYRLAILLNIKMPISGICVIDSKTSIYTNCLTPQQYGLGFYSTYLHKSVVLVDTIIKMMQNLNDFYKILLFDHIIFNKDRNPGNLLVQYYKKNITLQVIDHSHVFINQAIWDANCLNRAMEEKDYFSTDILKYNEYLYGMFFRNMNIDIISLKNVADDFRKIINRTTLNNIIADIPNNWLPSEKNLNALVDYLLYRVNHLDDICSTIINYNKL